MTKALAIIPGDIDGILAAKVVKEQGVDVIGVCFKSAFFSYESAVKEAEKIDIEIKIADITDEHFEIVKSNVNSYNNIENICIGCNLLKMSYAARLLEEIEGDFIVTGEILSRKRMSQNSHYTNIVIKKRNINELILRPLCAKELTPTIMEQSGIINRDNVISFSNNMDRIRIEFADEIGIKDNYHFQGHCKLSDPIFSSRLWEMLTYNKDYTPNDIEVMISDSNYKEK